MLKTRDYDQEAFARMRAGTLSEETDARTFFLASAEDIILNKLEWFEMGRTELLRANGLVYRDLEAAGIFFVVAELNVKYRRPAMYDESLKLETTCSKVTAGKVIHTYRLLRQDGLLLAEGSTVLACIGADRKVHRIPQFMYPQES